MSEERESKVKTQRLLQMDALIRSGCKPSMKRLMEEFEVSRSTINRDLDFLRTRYDAPLEYDETVNGYYYTDPSFAIKSVLLTEGELFTISAILPLMDQYKNTPLESSFKSIMNKMTEMLPDEVTVGSAFLTNEFSFISDPLPEIKPEVFEKVFDALKGHRTITFKYKKISSQNYVFKEFDPYHIICQKGNWYVIGYCHIAKDSRIYALSRMMKVELEDSTFKIPEDFRLEDHIDESFGIWNNNTPPSEIELLFDSSVNTFILERTWHSTQEIKQNSDGSVLLSFKSNQLQEVLHWVLSLGSSVKVLNPPELVEMVQEEARKISGKY